MTTTEAIHRAFHARLLGGPFNPEVMDLNDEEAKFPKFVGDLVDEWASDSTDPKPSRDLRILADALRAAADTLDIQGWQK